MSEASTVPRTRVYDAIDELQTRGLVDVQPSTPKRFWAISAETTGRHFEREYSHRVDALVESLDSLETSPTADERGVTVRLAGMSDPIEDVIRDEGPNARTFASLWDQLSGGPARQTGWSSF